MTELRRREAARTNLLDFTLYTRPGYVVGQHHRLICEAFEAVERGEISRLMLFAPPRHGKSEISSKRFPAWYLGRNPERQIISASYGQDLANDFGREVRNIVADSEYRRVFPNVSLAKDSAARSRWHTNKGGVFTAAGVGGSITGRGGHLLIIDDPLKNREDADSELERDNIWKWYTSTAYPRLMPGNSSIILIMTRWHEDDLAGRLLAEQASGADQWHVIDMPAVAQDGSALWPEAYDRDALDRIRRAIGERDWSALYQQQPRPAEGALFKTEKIETLDAEPAGGQVVRAWDLAATAQVGTRDPDWTAGVKLTKLPTGKLVILDAFRLRGGPDEVEGAIRNIANQDGKDVRVGLPQDPGQAAKGQVLYLTRALQGFKVESSPETGAKETRAAPIASQVNVGNVAMVRGSWNRAFLDELASFPSGTHDDMCDALSRAFMMLVGKPALIVTEADLNIARMGRRRF